MSNSAMECAIEEDEPALVILSVKTSSFQPQQEKRSKTTDSDEGGQRASSHLCTHTHTHANGDKTLFTRLE